MPYYDAHSSSDADVNAVVTIYWHDWRGNLRGIQNEAAPHTVQDVDNMGRVIAVAQYQGPLTWSHASDPDVVDDPDYAATRADDPGISTSKRGSLTETEYDQLGRVYRTEVYAVTASSGASGDKLVTDNYYDRNGRLVATYSNAQGGREIAFDGIGRTIESRLVLDLIADGANGKYDNTGAFNYLAPVPGADAGGLAGVLTISRSTYDAGGNVIASYNMEANHDATDGISLTTDNYVQTTSFFWYDDAGRLTDTADYGTYTTAWTYAAAPNRPDPDVAPDRSDTVLVTTYTYDAAGRVETIEDPRAIKTKFHYDDTGRTTATIANYWSGATYWTVEPLLPKSRDADKCQITSITYAIAGNTVTQVAVDPDHNGDTSDNQVTVYNYQDPYIPSQATRIKYPDSADAQFDSITMTYALDGQVVTRTSQRKTASATPTTITFDYDMTYRRLVKQRVTSIDTDAVDNSVLSMQYTYDELSRRKEITSYSANDCTNPVNEVLYEYNDLGALDKEYQEHEGEKDANTLYVQYNYDSTDSNPNDGVYDKGMRLASVRFPSVGATHTVRSGSAVDGRLVHMNYTASSIADDISRVDAIKDDANGDGTPDATPLSAYLYNGVSRIVEEDYEGPDVKLDYINNHIDPAPGAGEYDGFDRFGRVEYQTWRRYKTGDVATVDQYSYGYDRNSNRLYRENTQTGDKDELYAYGSLDRLTTFYRGDLNGNQNDIPVADRVRGQVWTLKQTGNWKEFKIDADGDGNYTAATDLNQTRTNNKANEIDGISQGSGQANWDVPAYGTRGNMTTAPKPADPENSYSCKYDAWGRPIEIKSGSNVVLKFEYDGLNRRTKKFINTGQDTSYDEFRHFFYNASWQAVEARKSTSENTQPETLQPEYQYVWSLRYVDAAVLRDKNTDTDDKCDDERLYYLNDANMNVTGLVQGKDGHADLGKVVERYEYDPYGVATALHGEADTDAGVTEWNEDTNPDWDNSILYCGYWLDLQSGMYNVRNRYYHPTLGLWPQRDPSGYSDGMSLYEYVRSNPITGIDPTGQWWPKDHIELTEWSFSMFGDWRGMQKAKGHITTPAPSKECKTYISASSRKPVGE